MYGWRRAQRRTHALRTVVQAGADNTVEVHIAMSTPRLREDLITYKIYPNGRLYVYHSAVPKQDMLRFGFQMTLPGSYEYVNWYGRGRTPAIGTENRGRAGSLSIYGDGAGAPLYASPGEQQPHGYLRSVFV